MNNNITNIESQIDDKYDELYDELRSFKRMRPEEQDKWLRDNEVNDDDRWIDLINIIIWREGL